MPRRCCFGGCYSDERYPERSPDVKFFPFPKPRRRLDECREWIRACGRPYDQLYPERITKHYYLCSKHFKEGRPTREYPYPIPYDGRPVKKARVSKRRPIEDVSRYKRGSRKKKSTKEGETRPAMEDPQGKEVTEQSGVQNGADQMTACPPVEAISHSLIGTAAHAPASLTLNAPVDTTTHTPIQVTTQTPVIIPTMAPVQMYTNTPVVQPQHANHSSVSTKGALPSPLLYVLPNGQIVTLLPASVSSQMPVVNHTVIQQNAVLQPAGCTDTIDRTGTGVRTDAVIRRCTGVRTNARMRTDTDVRTDASVKSDTGVKTDVGVRTDEQIRRSTGLRTDAGITEDTGLRTYSPGDCVIKTEYADTSVRTDTGSRRTETGVKADTCVRTGAGWETDADLKMDFDMSRDTGLQTDSGVRTDAQIRTDTGARTGISVTIDSGVRTSSLEGCVMKAEQCELPATKLVTDNTSTVLTLAGSHAFSPTPSQHDLVVQFTRSMDTCLTTDTSMMRDSGMTRDSGVTMATGVTRDSGVTMATGVTRDSGVNSGVTMAMDVTRDSGVTMATGVTRDSGVTMATGVTRDSGVTMTTGVTKDSACSCVVKTEQLEPSAANCASESMDAAVTVTDSDIVLQWRAVGKVKGLTTDADIARFLLSQYLNPRPDREVSQHSSNCSHCSAPLCCITCLSSSQQPHPYFLTAAPPPPSQPTPPGEYSGPQVQATPEIRMNSVQPCSSSPASFCLKSDSAPQSTVVLNSVSTSSNSLRQTEAFSTLKSLLQKPVSAPPNRSLQVPVSASANGLPLGLGSASQSSVVLNSAFVSPNSLFQMPVFSNLDSVLQISGSHDSLHQSFTSAFPSSLFQNTGSEPQSSAVLNSVTVSANDSDPSFSPAYQNNRYPKSGSSSEGAISYLLNFNGQMYGIVSKEVTQGGHAKVSLEFPV